MEKEKLIIKNFGPIKSVELDLGRFNILIGEQATGKSTVAKVLAVCRYFSYIVWDGEITGNNESSFSEGLEAWGLKEHIKENSYISYECKDYLLTVQYTPHEKNEWLFIDEETPAELEKIVVPVFAPLIKEKSKKFKALLLELEKLKSNNTTSGPGIIARSIPPTSFYVNDVKSVMDNPFYLPTQRGLQSIFSIGQNSIPNLSDALFNQLAKMDGVARNFTNETYIEPLDIFYRNIRGYGFVRKANETEYYSLFNAASGYQSMIPTVLAIKYYAETRRKGKTLLIEEPELDVFPSTQDKLIQYLSDKAKVYDSMVFLTTHSPYTLTSLNNLMYAYQVGQKNPEKVSKEIDKKYWLNPEDVSVYMMKPDGSFENIIDEEGLIKAEKIDEVSKTINTKFNAIMDIELGVDETTE